MYTCVGVRVCTAYVETYSDARTHTHTWTQSPFVTFVCNMCARIININAAASAAAAAAES